MNDQGGTDANLRSNQTRRKARPIDRDPETEIRIRVCNSAAGGFPTDPMALESASHMGQCMPSCVLDVKITISIVTEQVFSKRTAPTE